MVGILWSVLQMVWWEGGRVTEKMEERRGGNVIKRREDLPKTIKLQLSHFFAFVCGHLAWWAWWACTK